MKKFSSNAEMYLATLAKLQEDGVPEPIPVSALANSLGIGSVSAHQMIQKLEKHHLLSYTRYKGVCLTELGTLHARQVLRNRRLWEVFLVEILHFNQADAADIACQLEHVTPREAIDRLDAILGNPDVSPTGRKVPRPSATASIVPICLLTELETGESGVVSHLQAETQSIAYFNSLNIRQGCHLSIRGKTSQGEVLIEIQQGQFVTLSASQAGDIWVQKSD